MSLFSGIEQAPADPILGITEAYRADTRPTKVNLGVGVYLDETGKIPLLGCVRQAEQDLGAHLAPRGYLPIDGMPGYTTAVKDLIFGGDSEPVTSGRVVTVQALGGTGGLRIVHQVPSRDLPGNDLRLAPVAVRRDQAPAGGSGGWPKLTVGACRSIGSLTSK